MKDYKKIANKARKKVLELIYKAQTSHIGSNFSCADIMAVLFEKMDLNKDKFILSKGWAAASLYYFLWLKGKITEEELNSFCQEGSKFIGLSEPIHKDIPFAGGSMGLGLPAAVGFALSKKLKGEDGKVYCLMSDGEMQIGTTWESALIASHYKLDNLVVIVDHNELQAMGKTNDILDLGNILSKWSDFGFNIYDIDGHNYSEIEIATYSIKVPHYKIPRPKVFIAHTIKGKGVSFMEGVNLYHYKNLSEEEFNLSLKELEI